MGAVKFRGFGCFVSCWLCCVVMYQLTVDRGFGREQSAVVPVASTSRPVSNNVSTYNVSCTDAILGTFIHSTKFYKHRGTPALKWVKVFLRSALALAPASRCSLKIVLFADVETSKLLGDSAIFGITVVEVSNRTHSELLRQRWSAEIGNGANNYRFALYRNWLLQNQHVRRVVLSDVSDVVFQRSPFEVCFPEHVDDKTVIFTLEESKATFKSEKHNRKWMSCFGNGILRKLESDRSIVSCAGVTLATLHGALQYCDAVLELISRADIMDCSEKVVKAALDQAAHNVVLYASTTNLTRRPSPMTAPCVFHGNFGTPHFAANQLVAPNGETYAIVHQYTSARIPEMMRIAERRFGL